MSRCLDVTPAESALEQLPVGAPLTVSFDDESGTTMKVDPGRTAFLDCTQMYSSLSAEDKAWVEHSRAEYAPSDRKSVV